MYLERQLFVSVGLSQSIHTMIVNSLKVFADKSLLKFDHLLPCVVVINLSSFCGHNKFLLSSARIPTKQDLLLCSLPMLCFLELTYHHVMCVCLLWLICKSSP